MLTENSNKKRWPSKIFTNYNFYKQNIKLIKKKCGVILIKRYK